MRALLAPLAAALLGAGLAACGGAGRVASSASPTSSNAATPSGAPPAIPSTSARVRSEAERSTRHYLDDGDYDRVGDNDEDNSRDNDEDPYLDYKPPEKRGYHDSDDASFLAFGHAAGLADERAVAAVVKHYYALAAAGDAGRACATFPSSLVKAMPTIYGRFGQPYLLGARSCREVMERVFRAAHGELRAPVAVTGVRLEGDRAQALLGSKSMPASYVTLSYEGGVWRISGLIGGPLP